MKTIESAFIGRVGTEPELRTSAAGKPRAAFNVAVGQDDAVQWVRVAIFGDLAEQLAKTLQKSDRIYCEGTLKLNTWEKDGEKRAGLSVAAWKVEKLSQIGRNRPPKPKGERPDGDQREQSASSASAARDWQRPARDLDQPIPFAAEGR